MDSEKPNNVVPLFGGELSVERDPVEGLSSLAVHAVTVEFETDLLEVVPTNETEKSEYAAEKLLALCEKLTYDDAKATIEKAVRLKKKNYSNKDIVSSLERDIKRRWRHS